MFLSLDFVYVPTHDVEVAARHYCDALAGEVLWKVRGMDTVVAALRVSGDGPTILLSGHLHGPVSILVYRVADYTATIRSLRDKGVTDIRELEIPHGPCAK